MRYHRRDRVGDLIKREIAHIIQYELKDPGIGFTTITEVKMSADLKHAKVFYTVLGDENEKRNSAEVLKRAGGFIQREIGRRLRLRYTPEILFDFDSSIERSMHIEELIQKLHSKQEPDIEDPDLDEDLSEDSSSEKDTKNEK